MLKIKSLILAAVLLTPGVAYAQSSTSTERARAEAAETTNANAAAAAQATASAAIPQAQLGISVAKAGANSDITSLSGLSTPLSVNQGGTGASSASSSRANLGLGGAAVLNVGTAVGTVADGGALTTETSRATASEALKAPLAGATFTGSVTIPSGTVTAVVGTSTATPTNATASRTIADKLGDRLTVTDFGAKCNYNSYSAAVTTTASSAVVTTSTSVFTSSMVGQWIFIPGAGASGGLLSTTIASYQSATQVTLSAAASTALSAYTEYVGIGTDDTSTINSAATSLQYSHATLYFPLKSRCLVTYLVGAEGVNFDLGDLEPGQPINTLNSYQNNGSELVVNTGVGTTLNNTQSVPVGSNGFQTNNVRVTGNWGGGSAVLGSTWPTNTFISNIIGIGTGSAWTISGTGIASGTTVSGSSNTALTISQATTAAIASGSQLTVTYTVSLTTTAASTGSYLPINNIGNVYPGMTVSGTNVPSGSIVSSAQNGAGLIISQAPSTTVASGTALTLTGSYTVTTSAAAASGATSIPINGYAIVFITSMVSTGSLSNGSAISLGTKGINLASDEAIKNGTIVAAGVNWIPTTAAAAQAEVNQWSNRGNAITFTGHDNSAQNLMIVGFNNAMVVTVLEREIIEHIKSDGINGLVSGVSSDWSTINSWEAWPFYDGNSSIASANPTIAYRPGVGITAANLQADTKMLQMFVFGYQTDFWFNNVYDAACIGCYADNIVTINSTYNQVGFKIDGNSRNVTLVASQADSQAIAYYINIQRYGLGGAFPGSPVRIVAPTAVSIASSIYNINSGEAVIDAPAVTASYSAIPVVAGAGAYVDIYAPHFAGSTSSGNAYSVASGACVAAVGGYITGYTKNITNTVNGCN